MKHLFVLFLSMPVIGLSQNIQAEINSQVWEVFKSAYSTNDAELFNSVHSDDVIRVSSGGIKVGDVYKSSMSNFLNGMKERGQEMTIDFRFEKRIHEEDIAYEVGIYQLTRNSSDGPKEYYGRFHVVLKRINDIWKIVQDYDTPKVLGQSIDKEAFDMGKEMTYTASP